MVWCLVALWVGAVLEVGGIIVVVVGADAVMTDLFPERRPLPITRVSNRLATWRRRHEVPQLQSAHASPSVVTITGGPLSALVGTPTRPQEWYDHFERKIVVLDAQLRDESTERAQAVSQLRRELDEERRQRIAGDVDVREHLRVSVGGEGGVGLVWAFWGAVATFTGAALQGAVAIANR